MEFRALEKEDKKKSAVEAGPAGFLRLRQNVLQAGDIVLSTTSKPISSAIRTIIGSDISHALLCLGGNSVIDATGDGVHARNTQYHLFDAGHPVYLLRARAPLSLEQTRKITDYARSKIGSRYTTAETLNVIARRTREAGDRQFCSRLVAQAYAHAGILLFDAPSFCSPADLKNSALLHPVADGVEFVSASEAVEISTSSNVAMRMLEVSNEAMRRIRLIAPQVEAMERVFNYLQDHPQDDGQIYEAFRESGYLDMWQVELNEKPAHYYYEALDATRIDFSDMRAHCLGLIRAGEVELRNYQTNIHALDSFSGCADLATFRAHKQVFLIMTELAKKKISIAKEWLANSISPKNP